MKDQLKGREVIIEIIPQGLGLRVSAMDVQSLTEVVMPVPSQATKEQIKVMIFKKLEYVLRKKGFIE